MLHEYLRHRFTLQGSYEYWLVALSIALAMAAVYAVFDLARRVTATRDGEARFRILAEAIPQIVWTAVPERGFDYCNQRWYQLTGLSERQTLGSGWSHALHPDDQPVCLRNWKNAQHSGEPFEMEYRLRNAAGGYRWQLVRATPMRDSTGVIVKWFGACTDINDQMLHQQVLEEQVKENIAALMEANEALRDQSIRDPLTGLYNRRYMEEMLERETLRAVRADQGLGVLMLDLDHFKSFNDTYGHDAGDTILREAAAFLLKSVRAEDIVCRFGGEEFIVILPVADLKVTEARADRIRSKLRELPVLHQGQSLGMVTVSIGVAELPQHGTSRKELIEAADAALYRAKREGRDRVVVAEAPTAEAQPAAEIAPLGSPSFS
jgi:diguanylate cyclase (GGDEF)-like protein/PAS domain S-box-containing protein